MNSLPSFITSILFLLCGCSCAAQQLANRSGFAGADFIYNPAFTASDNFGSVSLIYQDQWSGYEDNPNDYNVAGQVPLLDGRIGIGASMKQTNAIGLRSNNFTTTYGYHFPLNLIGGDQLSLGLLVGVELLSFNRESITAVDPDDPLATISWSAQPGLSFGAGLLYTSDQDLGVPDVSGFFFAVGAPRLLTRTVKDKDDEQALFQTARYFNAAIGGRIDNGTLVVIPTVWAEYTQPGILLLSGRLEAELNSLWLGAGLASNGTLNAMAGYTLPVGGYEDNLLKIGLQYTAATGPNVRDAGGSFGVFIGLRIDRG